MITGYFDESGTDAANPVVGVAGYFSSCAMWKEFSNHWVKMLSDFGLSEFHRTDIENRHRLISSWTTNDRDLVCARAHKIIKRFTYIGIGNAVIKQDFEEVFPSILKRFYGGPYGYCAFLCAVRAKHWHENIRSQDSINWVFEGGVRTAATQCKVLMKAMYNDSKLRREYRIGTCSFSGTKAMLPLQAADTIAYELFKFIQGQVIENRKPRISFKDLVREKDHECLEFWPRPRLEEYVESDGIKALIKTLEDHRFLDHIAKSRQ